MPRVRTRSWAGLLLPFGAPVLALFVLRAVPGLDLLYRDVEFHLFVVSAIAGCALVVATAAARAGARSAQPGPVWLAFGCLCVGITMLTHGLLTPNVLGTPMNTWISRMPYLAIVCFAAALAAASRPRNGRLGRLASRRPGAVLLVPPAVLGTSCLAITLWPNALIGDRRMPHEKAIQLAVLVAAIAVYGAVGLTHWRRWHLGRDPVQYVLVVAAAMSTATGLSLYLGEQWRLSWWDYHAFLLTGFGAAVYAVWMRYRVTNRVELVLGETFDDDPMGHIVRGYPDALKTLVRAVEVKDAYTHGHSERTARIAVQLGLRLGLHEGDLRSLARGALLHDVGKIAVPDQILNKPAGLTPDERAVIQTHPRIGCELVTPVRELAEALPAVLHHHERWDGTGYPSGLHAERIPLLARIVAIADVWDALTSDRSYRPGMAPEDALAHMDAGRGSHFDPALFDAFVALAADWGYGLTWTAGDAEEAWRAAETCHEALASTRG